jgi:lipopolysaccharide export system permease protein
MIEDGRSFFIYSYYTLLNFPKIISKILPFALFFSFSYVLTKYELNNELIIFWNIGINKIELVNFFFKISIILTIIQIFFTSIITPHSQHLSRTLIKKSNIDFLETFIKPKRFNDTINGLTIYSDGKKEDGTLKNIYLKKKVNNDNFQITYAKEGIFENRNGSSVLVLYDGETINGNNEQFTNFKFSKSDFNLSNFKSNTITAYKIQETPTLNLFNCVNELLNNKGKYLFENCSKTNLDNIFEELFKRILIPFYIPCLLLVTLLLILKSKEESNYLKLRIFVFLFGFSIIIFSETTLKFISNNLIHSSKIIFIPFIFMFFLYLLFFYKFKFKFKNKKIQ